MATLITRSSTDPVPCALLDSAGDPFTPASAGDVTVLVDGAAKAGSVSKVGDDAVYTPTTSETAAASFTLTVSATGATTRKVEVTTRPAERGTEGANTTAPDNAGIAAAQSAAESAESGVDDLMLGVNVLTVEDTDATGYFAAGFGSVTVGDYAENKSPADLVLETPAQKLVTDADGRVSVGAFLGQAVSTAFSRFAGGLSFRRTKSAATGTTIDETIEEVS